MLNLVRIGVGQKPPICLTPGAECRFDPLSGSISGGGTRPEARTKVLKEAVPGLFRGWYSATAQAVEICR